MNKVQPCSYCHRLPLRAGGCNLECVEKRINKAFSKLTIAGLILEMTTLNLLKEKQNGN